MSRQSLEQQQAIEYLHEYLNPGDTVYTILRHVSRSGMSRSVSALVMTEKGEPYEISHLVAKAVNMTFDRKNGGVKVSGCGMDAGFEVVYNLAYALWPDGFDCIGDNCPSNDHVNHVDAEHHKSGGYALRHRWL